MTVLITGASKGIGKDMALEFAKQGHNLALIARSTELLEELKTNIEKSHPIKVTIYTCDLADDKARRNFLNSFTESIEIVINNAGYGDFAFFADADIDKNLKMVDLNIKALMELCHHFSKKFIIENDPNKNYKILNVASIAGFCPGSFMATYYATKAFVLSFTNALHSEFKTKGIHFASLCPGATHSEFGKEAGVSNSFAFKMAMSGARVAKITYKNLMKNKRIIIPGIRNKLIVAMLKMTPSDKLADMNGQLMSTSN